MCHSICVTCVQRSKRPSKENTSEVVFSTAPQFWTFLESGCADVIDNPFNICLISLDPIFCRKAFIEHTTTKRQQPICYGLFVVHWHSLPTACPVEVRGVSTKESLCGALSNSPLSWTDNIHFAILSSIIPCGTQVEHYKARPFRCKNFTLKSTPASMANSATANALECHTKLAAICSPCIGPQRHSIYLTPLRKHAQRSLGAGAFMKDETLRGVDGRILRHGKFDCVASRRRTVDATVSITNVRIAASRTIKESVSLRRRRGQQKPQGRCSHGERLKAYQPKSPKSRPLSARPSHNPYHSTENMTSDDGSTHPAWNKQWYICYWTKMMQDIQQADEMFRLFINTDECEDTMCTR